MNEEETRRIVRDELRKILDTGLMYTAESKNAPQAKPQKTEENPQTIDMDSMTWIQVEGKKSPWAKSTTQNTVYYEIKKLIEEKHGFPVVIGDFKVWLCDDGSLGRRKK